MEKEFLKKRQRTLQKKVSKVRIYEAKKAQISYHYDGTATSCLSFTFL